MTSALASAERPAWRELLQGVNGLRLVVLASGVAVHAVNLYVTSTLLPSVVADIGGVAFYAWNTSLFVVASIVGAALAAQLLAQAGAGGAYAAAATIFGAGSAACALAPAMSVMIAGRVLQGLGGGMLLSMPYVLLRSVLPERLWPHAVALLSGMWGVATLLGPALGGLFAQYASWRFAFWSLLPVIALLAGAALAVFRAAPGSDRPPAFPVVQLSLLVAAVVIASWSSLSDSAGVGTLGLASAFATLVVAARIDKGSACRVLPAGVYVSHSPLAALYAVSALLSVPVTCTEIFVPLFLQRLHGHGPLAAGYVAASASAGWTLAAVVSAKSMDGRAGLALRAAAVCCSGGLVALAFAVPFGAPSTSPVLLVVTIIALALVGAGVGSVWPLLATAVMKAAPREDHDRASASIMTVQLVATAFGAALGGVILNSAGPLPAEGGRDMAAAARWLFLVFAAAPLGACALCRARVVAAVRGRA